MKLVSFLFILLFSLACSRNNINEPNNTYEQISPIYISFDYGNEFKQSKLTSNGFLTQSYKKTIKTQTIKKGNHTTAQLLVDSLPKPLIKDSPVTINTIQGRNIQFLNNGIYFNIYIFEHKNHFVWIRFTNKANNFNWTNIIIHSLSFDALN